MSNRIGIFTSAVIVAGSAAAVWLSPHAYASQCLEDMPCWSCVDDGNRVCGPGNSEGKPAACYDDGGVIVAYWPCEPWKSDWAYADGSICVGSVSDPTLGTGDDETACLSMGGQYRPVCLSWGYTPDQLFSTDNPDCPPDAVLAKGHGHSHHYTKG